MNTFLDSVLQENEFMEMDNSYSDGVQIGKQFDFSPSLQINSSNPQIVVCSFVPILDGTVNVFIAGAVDGAVTMDVVDNFDNSVVLSQNVEGFAIIKTQYLNKLSKYKIVLSLANPSDNNTHIFNRVSIVSYLKRKTDKYFMINTEI